MYISELIKKLQEIKEDFGEVVVGLDREDIAKYVFDDAKDLYIGLNYFDNYHDNLSYLGYIGIKVQEF